MTCSPWPPPDSPDHLLLKHDYFDNGDYDDDNDDYDENASLKRNLSSCLPVFSGLNLPSAISTSGKSSKLLVSSIDLTLVINFFVNRHVEGIYIKYVWKILSFQVDFSSKNITKSKLP